MKIKILIVVIVCLLVAPFVWFGVKERQTKRNLQQAFSEIQIPSNYQLIGSVCSKEGFKPFCEYRFYTAEPLDQSTANITKLLTSAGFTMSSVAGGLDGPNQQAFTGNNTTSNTYLTYKELERGKYAQYEQVNGNVHFRIYPAD